MKQQEKKPLIILTGPTAAGKTSLSIELAKSIGGEIISADSMAIEFELRFKNIRKEAFIGVFVESEVGLMDAHSWKTGIGTVFPITGQIHVFGTECFQ